MRTRTTILALLCTTALAACGTEAETDAEGGQAAAETQPSKEARVAAETERLNAWFDEAYEESVQRSPMQMTRLGRKDRYGEIDDMSEAAADERLAWMRNKAQALRSDFDRDLLTDEAKLSYDLWLYQLEDEEAGLAFRRHRYLFNQMGGVQTGLPQFLITKHDVATRADMEAYISRIGGVARAIGQTQQRAQLSADEGVHPPRFAYEGALEQTRALLEGAPFTDGPDSPLYADAKAKIDALVEDGEIDEDTAETLREETRRALIGSFEPAYRSLIAFMEEDLENVSDAPQGASSLPDGEAYYGYALANQTTTDLSADEIHQIGLDEVARIREQMEGVMETVGFDGTLQEFFEFVRSDPQFYYPNTDEGREEYLEAARGFLSDIEQKLPEYFGLLPEAPLVVRRVEAFREEDGAAQHYSSGTPDGARPGIFYVHLSDMNAMPIPQIEVIAYHEGIPGHHMQISIAQELDTVPEFRTQAGFGAYVEGWALYSEQLAEEMGQYEDPYSYFGRLTTEIWRAIRLVVDTGMHAKGWSEEEAVAYFTENSPAAEGQIRSEVRRYLIWPGQATSYKIGMLKILELREKARGELGDRFDIRGFHDAVLGGGALPLDLLEARVDNWIESQRAA